MSLKTLATPEAASSRLWQRIERTRGAVAIAASAPVRARLGPAWAVAAAVIAVLSFAAVPTRAPARLVPLGDTPPRLDLGSYLVQRSTGAPVAPATFLAAYMGVPVAPEEALRRVHFAGGSPGELPGGFRRDSTHLFRTACCTGVHARYVKNGAIRDLFLQPAGHPIEWGGCVVERYDLAPGRELRIARADGAQAVAFEQAATLVALAGRFEGPEDILQSVNWLTASLAGENVSSL